MSGYQSNIPLDRSHVYDVVDSIRSAPPVDQTVYGSSQDHASSSSKKKKNHHKASDNASIRSTGTFSSTVGLLKDKFHRSSSSKHHKDSGSSSSSSSKKEAKEQKKILSSQMSIVG